MTPKAGGVPSELAALRQLSRPAVVMVSRDGRRWRAEIAALSMVRHARSLSALDRRVRELLGTDAVDYQFYTGDPDLDRLVMQIRSARASAQRFHARALHLTGRALTLPSGGSGRDLAVLLGLSHQRVHQLMRENKNVCPLWRLSVTDIVERSDGEERKAEFHRVMDYVAERAWADGLEEDVMAVLFDVLDGTPKDRRATEL